MGQNNQTLNTVTTAAGLIPVIGGVLATIGNIASSLGLKGKTRHLSWQEADNLARPFADNMTQVMESNFVPDDEAQKRLYTAIVTRITGFIAGDEQGSTWWTQETRSLYWNAFTYELPRNTSHDSLWYCFWLYSHWVYENVDGQHIDTEGVDKLNYIAGKVLIPALKDAGFIVAVEEVKVDQTTGTPQAKTTAVTSASLFGSDKKTLVIIAIVLFVVAILYHQHGG